MLFNKSKNPKMDEVREFVPVSASSDFDSVLPHIVNAERDYIKPLIGIDMYDELEEFYEGMPYDTPTEVQMATEELLKLVQGALIHIAYWIGFDLLNAHVSDSGFQRIESDQIKGLYKYQEDNVRVYFKSNGFNGLDAVLEYLETNIQHFGEFKLSSKWTERKEMFIPDTKAFEAVPYNLNGSRLIYLRLVPHMSYIEDTVIRKILGESIFTDVKTEMVKDAPAAKVVKLLPFIRKPLAHLSVAMLMEESGADLTEKGLFFEATQGGFNSDAKKEPADKERVLMLVGRARRIGDEYLEGLKRFFMDNLSDWTDYSQQTGSVLRRDNNDKKTFWA